MISPKLLTTNLRRLFLLTAFIACIVLVSGCTFTTTKTIHPVFTLTPDSISRDINSIIITSETNITGKEISMNGQISTQLIVNLIHSKNLPKDVFEQDKLGENIAILIKNMLKDPESFTDYEIIFTQGATDGTITKSSNVSFSYQAKDLKNYIQIVSLGDQFDPRTSQAIGKSTFSANDPNIVSVFTYYNNVPGSRITVNMYKDTDSGKILLTSRDQQQILKGNNYLVNKLTIADFYKTKELGSGKYRIDYLVSDTVAGSKGFILE